MCTSTWSGGSVIKRSVNKDQLGCVMKKFMVIVCTAILAFGVAGCAGKGKAPMGKGKSPVVQTKG